MKIEIITISDSGAVAVPDRVIMRDFEIAELLGVFVPTVKTHIRTILKSNIITADLTNGATLVGNNILPDYHGLDMVVAVAFRVQSPQAEMFRRWVMKRLLSQQSRQQPMFIQIPNSQTIN